jgi:geranylgeranyl diphosphate synthase type I
MKDALSGGKRVRAILALLWCEALSNSPETAMPVAVAYELAHAAALVQDDIVDNSDLRRGTRSIVSKYGLRSALLASNMLLAQVPTEISEYGKLDPSGETLKKLFEVLGESYGAAILGEFLDLEMADRNDVLETEYESMIRLKTGALVGASSASGAIVGGGIGRDEIIKAAYGFGEYLGMAYQVRDDLLDVMGDQKALGKPIFSDIRSGKKNVIVIHTLEECSQEDKRFLTGLLDRKEPFDESGIDRARSLFVQHGSIEYAQTFASKYVDAARSVLDSVELQSEPRAKLLELSGYLADRSY